MITIQDIFVYLMLTILILQSSAEQPYKGGRMFLSYLNSVNDKPSDASEINWDKNDFARRVYQNLKPDYSSNWLHPLYINNEMPDLSENSPILSANQERLLSHEYNKDSNALPVVDETDFKDLYLSPYQNVVLMDTDPNLAIQWSKEPLNRMAYGDFEDKNDEIESPKLLDIDPERAEKIYLLANFLKESKFDDVNGR